MPTVPIENLLTRNLPSAIDKVLTKLSGAIDETVNYGTHVLNWCGNSGVTGNEHAPIFLSFRHVLELIDATSVLVRQSCFEPAKVLLRSIFDSNLNIEYLLESNFECRSRDFLFFYLLEQKKNLQQILSKKEAQLPIVENPTLKKNISFTIRKLNNEIKIFEHQLNSPMLADSKSEYSVYKKKHHSNPNNWFSLRDGPQSIFDLAKKLNKTERYIILYKEWSRLIHGTGIFRNKFQKAKDGGTFFIQLRLPADNAIIPSLAISFGLEAIRLMIKKYAPQKESDLDKWYATEIRELLMSLSVKKPIQIIELD